MAASKVYFTREISPEALVRRATWNKGLRCRRGYGDQKIPVAFVKGKVAVYVTEEPVSDSLRGKLEKAGWTVMWYKESSITDGKDEGAEIVAQVKANIRASKTSKRKSKK